MNDSYVKISTTRTELVTGRDSWTKTTKEVVYFVSSTSLFQCTFSAHSKDKSLTPVVYVLHTKEYDVHLTPLSNVRHLCKV